MLEDIKILNGTLDLAYNEYIYEYTVEVDSDTPKLDIFYECEDGTYIEILNNDLKEVNNVVYLKASKDGEEKTYTFYVHKNIESITSGIDLYKESLEVESEEFALYKVQILGISIFLIIVIIFSLFFKRKML